jgi:hypothetical protein
VIKDALKTEFFITTLIILNTFIHAYFRIKPPLIFYSAANPTVEGAVGWGEVRKLSPEVLHESYKKSYITESDTKLQYG